MTYEEACAALSAWWIAQWPLKAGGTQAAPTVPYALDNRKLAQPATTPFAIVEISHLSSDQATFGGIGVRKFERLGRVDVKLYGPRDQGTLQLNTLAMHVRDIFEAKRIGQAPGVYGIDTFATSINPARTDKEFPDLWCVLVRTGFRYHERR